MIKELAYLAFEVADIAAWRAFCGGVLGLQLVGGADATSFVARMDQRAGRFFVTEGPADDLVAVGWQMNDHIALDGAVHKLEEAGFEVEPASASDANARLVERLVRVADPAGTPLELVLSPQDADEPFTSALVPGGFVTGDMGLGHVVVGAPDRAASTHFYRDLLGFRLSDHIRCEIFGYPVDLAFWHCNGRHHSLAFGGATEKRLHHFLVEAVDLDAVGRAWDRTLRAKLPVANALGRHPNDKMLSFYACTPSGFQYEFGWDGRVIDDSTWDDSAVYGQVSQWGHNPPVVIGKRQAPPPGAK
jgi:2,3-dihydroxybiphenyl 1,2-dioxygenase